MEVHIHVYRRIYSLKFSEFRPNTTIYPPNENIEYGYPHSNALVQFPLNLESCKPPKAARHPTTCDLLMTSNYFRQYMYIALQDVLSQIFDATQSDFAVTKSRALKCSFIVVKLHFGQVCACCFLHYFAAALQRRTYLHLSLTLVIISQIL